VQRPEFGVASGSALTAPEMKGLGDDALLRAGQREGRASGLGAARSTPANLAATWKSSFTMATGTAAITSANISFARVSVVRPLQL